MSILDQLPLNAAVAVIRLRSLGDTVLTTPALALLKRARPDLRVAVVVDRPFAALLEGSPDVDETVALERGGSFFSALRKLRRLSPQLCLNLHGGSTSAWLTLLCGARFRVGYGHFRNRFCYNRRIPRAQQILGLPSEAPLHTAKHHASAIFFLGAARSGIPRARLSAEPLRRERPYAVLHVAATYETKRWSGEGFRSLARTIERKHGLEPIIIAGPGEDALLDEYAEFTSMNSLAVGKLKSLMAGARLFVGNDSGPAHVAAAFGVPCVVVFGSSDSRVWGPWRTAHRIVETEWNCKPCPGDRCYAFEEPRCILSIEPGRVEAAVEKLLADSPTGT